MLWVRCNRITTLESLMLKKLLPAMLGALLASTAIADEAVVRKTSVKFGAKAESVTKSGYLGLYEIYADGQILYSDERAPPSSSAR